MPAWVNLANLLTASRLAATPFVVAAILGDRFAAAAALFAAAAATDGLDGWVARHRRTITKAGAYLDAIADKALLASVLLAMAATGAAPWWYAAIVFGRDAGILLFAAAALAFTSHRRFTPSLWGKVSTVLQMAAVVSLLSRGVWPAVAPQRAAIVVIWISAAATIWSAIHYAWRAARG